MNEAPEKLCPFSKPLIGQWCQCDHARLADRCSGKMVCSQEKLLMSSCEELVEHLTLNSRFTINVTETNSELTHAQLMKIRCGGLQGIHRELGFEEQTIPDVPVLIMSMRQQYTDINSFPCQLILRDIKDFSHRKNKC